MRHLRAFRSLSSQFLSTRGLAGGSRIQDLGQGASGGAGGGGEVGVQQGRASLAGKPAPPEVANRGGNAGVQATDNTAGSSFVAGEGPANSCIEGSEEFGEAEEARDDSIGSKLPSGEDTLKTREPHPPQNPEVSGPVPAADQTPIPDPSQTAGVGGAGSRPAGVVDGGALDPTKDIPPTEPITGTERGAHQAPRPTHTTDPRN